VTRSPDWLHWPLLAITLWSLAVEATVIEDLQAQGRLSIAASLSPAENVVAGQKLALVIEIATDRWFTGGTRLALPEVPGLVILQTEQFASNATEMRGTQSWVLQRWTLDVYPQRAGDFTIPSVRARVRVDGGEAGAVEGDLFSPATRFSASLPAGLQADQHWVAAPEFSVVQTFDRELDGLGVGDAFERQLRFEASDLMAMMLPEFSPKAMPGLGIYPSPPELANTSNRGEVRASRVQRVSYVVEKGGVYRLPAEEFFWWDTARGELRLVRLDEVVFAAGSGAPAGENILDPVHRRMLLAVGAALLVFLSAATLLWRYFPRTLTSRIRGRLHAVIEQWREWRKPALPAELNPGSSAGARKASRLQ
jgi:hypothetical protein